MKTIAAWWSVVVCLFAALAPIPAQASADDAATAVLRADTARIDAMIAADTAALDNLLTADCLYVHSNAWVQTKAELLAALKSGELRYKALRYLEPPQVRFYGNETAVLTGSVHLEGLLKEGKTLRLTLRVTETYVLQQNTWRLASYQSTSVSARTTAPAAASLFDYDRAAPLNVREAGAETRDGVLQRDLTFDVAGRTIKAYVVAPATGSGPFAGILYVHWLGEPATTNRTEFLDEARALAREGVVSLLIDAMWTEPQWYKNRVPEEDYAHALRQVIELRRAMDLLLAQPGVDPKRIAYVGHDFGAMYGTVMGAVDQRAKTYVLMAGVPHFIDWFLFSRQPKDLAAYRAQIAPLDPVGFVSQLAPATVFFQFASKDEYVSAAAAAEFHAAALPRKQTATYTAGHDLHTPEVAADRVAWLRRELEVQN